MRNFIIKFKAIFCAIFIFVPATLFVSSCEDPPPACEEGDYGTVNVKNESGYSLWVDVTWDDYYENDERKVYDGSYTAYTKVPAGRIEVWGSFDRIDWTYDIENLSACEYLNFTWTLSYKKSSDGSILTIITIRDKTEENSEIPNYEAEKEKSAWKVEKKNK